MKKLPLWTGHIVAGVVSFLTAFFTVFNVLFSDIFGVGQKFGAIVYVFAVYLIWSIILHWLWRGTKAWLWWLLTPAVAFALFIAVQDGTRFGYILSVVLAAAVGAFGGFWLWNKKSFSRPK